MAGVPATIKQADLTRALKAARAAGLEVAAYKIGPDGSIEIRTGKPQENAGGEGGLSNGNPWDTI